MGSEKSGLTSGQMKIRDEKSDDTSKGKGHKGLSECHRQYSL